MPAASTAAGTKPIPFASERGIHLRTGKRTQSRDGESVGVLDTLEIDACSLGD